MEEITTVIKGTELKVLFTANIEGEDIAYSDTLYKILYYTTDKSKALVCSSVVEENTLSHVINEEGILVRIPTEKLEPGALKCEATFYLNDSDFNNDIDTDELEPSGGEYDGYRKEIQRETTKIKIIE